MAADREPSLGELSDDIGDLKKIVEKMRDAMDTSYVRQDVYRAQQEARDAKAIALQLRMDAAEQRGSTNFRLAISAFIGPLIVGIVIWVLLRSGNP